MKVIASANGINGVAAAWQALVSGQDTLNAAIEGVTVVEDDPNDLTVGYGGLPNENGVVELDAAVMHGPTGRSGGVAAMQGFRHAAKVAQRVMSYSDHLLLVGEGASRFAFEQGFLEENLLTDKARRIWLYWKQLNPRGDRIPPPVEMLDDDVRKFFRIADDHGPAPASSQPAGPSGHQAPANGGTSYSRSEATDRPTGTVHMACRNSAGDISCVTSTSGLAFKLPGRVGDSPIVGAGLFVDNRVGSCGSTGRGEANLKSLSSLRVVELMRQGRSPEDSGMEVLRQIVEQTTEPRLLGTDGRPNFGLKFYILAADGTHAAVSMWGPTKFAIADDSGARLEACTYLFEK